MELEYPANVSESWAETIFVVLILVGFFIALLLNSALLSYIVITLSGLLAGRFFYKRRTAQPIFPFILVIVGFLFGFMIGGSLQANPIIIAVLFTVTAVASYILHQKGYLEYFKTAGFIR